MITRASASWQARVDQGQLKRVGVNCYKAEENEPLEVRIVEHEHVFQVQQGRLRALKESRDPEAVQQALRALRAAAEDEGKNLLEYAVNCMKVRATLGEVSAALEEVFGRYEPRAAAVSGAYGEGVGDSAEWITLRAEIASFQEIHGRRPRILVAKLGQDGHDRGAKVVASGFADAGFDVDVGPLFQTPKEVARAAQESDVHVVGISTQAGAHRVLIPQLVNELRSMALSVAVVCGGIIPEADRVALREAGVAEIFEPGTRISDAARRVLRAIGAPE
jgi:methylmalonyl-CoA mutase